MTKFIKNQAKFIPLILLTFFFSADLAIAAYYPPGIFVNISPSTADTSVNISVSGEAGTDRQECWGGRVGEGDYFFGMYVVELYTVANGRVNITSGPFAGQTIPVTTFNDGSLGDCTIDEFGIVTNYRSGNSRTFSGDDDFGTSSLPNGGYTVEVRIVNTANQTDYSDDSFNVQHSCTLTISPTSRSVSDLSGTGSISVTSNCSWTSTVASGGSWLTRTSGSSGSGNGTVGYSYSENNSTSQRQGTITVSASGVTRTFTLTQAGEPVPTTAPDLDITSFSVPNGSPGQSVTASVTVANIGDASTGSSFEVAIDRGATSMTCSTAEDAAVTTSSLGAGSSRTISIPLTLPSTANSYTAVVMADSDCAISEDSESNNTMTDSYTVSAGMSGSLSASDCTISAGGSTCSSSISWSTTNPVATSAVTTPTNITVATGNSGSTSYSVSEGTRTFYLYNNGVELDQDTVTASCTSGTTWNGSICSSGALPTANLQCYF